jgi:FkbM family methyltransferase
MRPLELAVFLKWALRVKRMEVEARGIKLWVDPASNVGKRILREGNYEADLTAAFRELLRPGQTVVDVGANEGWFSMLAAKLVGPTGLVVACEPQERLWPAILKNIALNDFATVKLLPFAIGRERGIGEINLYPSLNTGSSHISGAKLVLTDRLIATTKPLDPTGADEIIESSPDGAADNDNEISTED